MLFAVSPAASMEASWAPVACSVWAVSDVIQGLFSGGDWIGELFRSGVCAFCIMLR